MTGINGKGQNVFCIQISFYESTLKKLKLEIVDDALWVWFV